MGGVQIKHRAHAGLNHQKSVILYDQNARSRRPEHGHLRLVELDEPVGRGQVEHNIFTTKSDLVLVVRGPVRAQVEQPGGVVENTDFVAAAAGCAEQSGAGGRRERRAPVRAEVVRRAVGAPLRPLLDTTSTLCTPTDGLANLAETPRKTETARSATSLPIALRPGTTYYWKVVGKTMALKTKTSRCGASRRRAAPPPPPPTGSADIVLYASTAPLKVGAWQVESDSTAAGGTKMRNPKRARRRSTAANANPAPTTSS